MYNLLKMFTVYYIAVIGIKIPGNKIARQTTPEKKSRDYDITHKSQLHENGRTNIFLTLISRYLSIIITLLIFSYKYVNTLYYTILYIIQKINIIYNTINNFLKINNVI